MKVCKAGNSIEQKQRDKILLMLKSIVSDCKGRPRSSFFTGLVTYHVIQFTMSQFDIMNDSNDNINLSARRLVILDIIILFSVVTALLCSLWSPIIIDKYLVLFDSIIFALTVSWLIIGVPYISKMPEFYAINAAIATLIVCLDLWKFRDRFYYQSSKGIKLKSSVNGNEENLSLGLAKGIRDSGKNAVEKKTYLLCKEDQGVDNRLENEEFNSSLYRASAATAAVSGSNNSSRDATNKNNHRAMLQEDQAISYMPRDIDLTKKGVCEGFRVNLNRLPPMDSESSGSSHPNSIPRDLPWETFDNVQHCVDSSSCHIYTATWGDIPVVLKLIKAERIASSVALAEFDTEESVLSRVRHPHIVRLLGSGTVPRKYLVLEYLSGGTLSTSLGVRPDVVKQRWLKKFTLLETLRIAQGLAQALNYLHNDWSNNIHIIHRDLKPDNIGWSEDGVLKLFDFGLSVSVRAQRERTEQYRLTGNTGTLRYMAPEVVLGRSYHKSVDTYSFGILIWQVAAGKIPFRDMGKKTYFDRVVVGGFRPKIDSYWPTRFSDLLRGCWHEDKNARPSFAEVVAELALLIQEEEEVQRRKTNRIWMRCWQQVSRSTSSMRPLLLVFCAAVVVFSFPLANSDFSSSSSINSGSNSSSVMVLIAAILGCLSSLVFYATAFSYLGVWPQVLQYPVEMKRKPVAVTTVNNNVVVSSTNMMNPKHPLAPPLLHHHHHQQQKRRSLSHTQSQQQQQEEEEDDNDEGIEMIFPLHQHHQDSIPFVKGANSSNTLTSSPVSKELQRHHQRNLHQTTSSSSLTSPLYNGSSNNTANNSNNLRSGSGIVSSCNNNNSHSNDSNDDDNNSTTAVVVGGGTRSDSIGSENSSIFNPLNRDQPQQ